MSYGFPATSPEDVLAELRSRSALPVLAGLVVGAVFLALLLNLFSSAVYDLYMAWASPATDGTDAVRLRAALWLAAGSLLLAAPLVLYLFWLARSQKPQVRRVVTLVLPFAKVKDGNGKERVVLVPLARLHAHEGLDEALRVAVKNAQAATVAPAWAEGWALPAQGDGSPCKATSVVWLYDLIEWLVIREIVDYGRHLQAGKGMNRPGDDLNASAPLVNTIARSRLFGDERPNLLWAYSDNPEQSKLNLPVETNWRWEELPAQHGVLECGPQGAQVRALALGNPGGVLTVRPSQIWRRATRAQHRHVVEHQGKLPSGVQPGDVYACEVRVALDVTLRQGSFLWPWARDVTSYQLWLLELQEQIIRHADMDRYVEADYRRMVVEIRDRVQKTGGPAQPQA